MDWMVSDIYYGKIGLDDDEWLEVEYSVVWGELLGEILEWLGC